MWVCFDAGSIAPPVAIPHAVANAGAFFPALIFLLCRRHEFFMPHLCRRRFVLLDFLWRPAHSLGMTRPYRDDMVTADRPFSGLAQRIAEQRAYVQRMIVNGAPTQAAEDRLRELERKRDRVQPADHFSLREPPNSAWPWQ
jgi:hypothetical protein